MIVVERDSDRWNMIVRRIQDLKRERRYAKTKAAKYNKEYLLELEFGKLHKLADKIASSESE